MALKRSIAILGVFLCLNGWREEDGAFVLKSVRCL